MLEVQLKFLAMFLLGTLCSNVNLPAGVLTCSIGKELGEGRAINTRLDALEKLCVPHLDVFDTNMLQVLNARPALYVPA